MTQGVVSVNQNTMYPLLWELEEKEMIVAEWEHPDAPVLLGCYHVSQQNTFTGRLTPGMLDGILARANEIVNQTGSG